MIWIKPEDVILIHSKIIQTTGGIDGLRDLAGLEAAVAAPLQSFAGQDLYPSELEKIARLGYGLASNHAFVDGNKRIGAMMTQLLLKWNSYQLEHRHPCYMQHGSQVVYTLPVVLLIWLIVKAVWL